MRTLQICAVVAALPIVSLASGTACEKLTSLTIPNVTIRSAVMRSAGTFPGVAGALPEFCRVQAVAHPVADSEIEFEVWMPAASSWNGKFQGVGNGGYSGSISNGALAQALRLGFAAASHNTGHNGEDMTFGQGHPEKVVDYAHRAAHVMTENAKLIVRSHLGRFADKAYFVGCSAGGHQALSEAQRYPEDYDGIIAGAPANNRIGQTFGFLWSWMALHKDDGSPVIPPAKLPLVTKAVVQACDASDGLKDGLVGDPRKCKVDLSGILTGEEEAAVRKVWAGAKSPKTEQTIFPGFAMGSENIGGQGWGRYLLDPKEPMRVDFFRYFLFHDPNWNFQTIDWDRDLAYANDKLPFFPAVDPDLSRFRKRGGKLLMYSGWSDPVVSPLDNVNYYEKVTKTMSGAAPVGDFFRLFMVPGMGHCGGGPGPDRFDGVAALDAWVTKGTAPQKMIASHQTNGVVDRTRPLCPYPQVARYKGTGSVDEAANFVCAVP